MDYIEIYVYMCHIREDVISYIFQSLSAKNKCFYTDLRSLLINHDDSAIFIKVPEIQVFVFI